ncbi:WYL domain-containing protein [Natrinema soli]|uniref:WYL domain-containing protein n=1 Tax=Natrinema soli TaxID=1930624 RepID=A0ABD5SZS3_9EURY
MRDTICEAINDRQTLSFTYDRLPRTVEPHKVGRTTKGNVVLSGYQIGGRSRSNSVPYWRLYKLGKMGDLTVNKDQFDGPRPEYKRSDKRMTQIYCRL